MDYGEILYQIKQRWITLERYELIKAFEEAPQYAATGGEGMGMIAGFLLDIKQNDAEAFNEISDLMEEFAKECAAYGLRLNGYNYETYWRS